LPAASDNETRKTAPARRIAGKLITYLRGRSGIIAAEPLHLLWLAARGVTYSVVCGWKAGFSLMVTIVKKAGTRVYGI